MQPKVDMLLSWCEALNCTPNQLLGLEKSNSRSPITTECASMIESMTASQKQWIFLTIDGLRQGFRNIENTTRLRTDFLRPSSNSDAA